VLVIRSRENSEEPSVHYLELECLQCGEVREASIGPRKQLKAGECTRCGYLGWARSEDLSELVRRALRERPVPRRRLRAVA
jgi:predicted RNA-binding Zn-ribbon protein involved in translation (DUF1610 family)